MTLYQRDSVSPCSFLRRAGRAIFTSSPEFWPEVLGDVGTLVASNSDVPSSFLPSCERY